MIRTLAGVDPAEDAVARLNAIKEIVAAEAAIEAAGAELPDDIGNDLRRRLEQFKEMKTACENIMKLIKAVRRCEEIAAIIKQRVLVRENILPRYTDAEMDAMKRRDGETHEQWRERNKEWLFKLRPGTSDLNVFGVAESYLPPQFKGEDRGLMVEFTDLVRSINRILRSYRAKPLIHGWAAASSWKVHWLFPDLDYRGYEYWERKVAMDVLQIAADGKISRFRECRQCSQWFIAKTAHQAFHDEKCRQKHLSQSPQYKAKRARYMRETYRPAERQREQRSKDLVRTERQKRRP